MIERIVSGGQTGVDRAALDVALELGIACGGWCPKGRRAEDGVIATIYPLKETPSRDYAERTRLNVRDSDATLILVRGPVTGGTFLTVEEAMAIARPHHVANPDRTAEATAVAAWISETGARVLNVAGPRETSDSGIGESAVAFLRALLG